MTISTIEMQKILVVENPHTPVDILVRLANDDSYRVRCSVAKNLRTPTHVLIKLSLDKDPSVRMYVGLNVKSHPSTLARLAFDKDVFVQKAAAWNPHTPANDLEDELGWWEY